jgi:hypothetical protein
MAVVSFRVTVGTQPVRLDTAPVDNRPERNMQLSTLVCNRGTVPMYIGGPNVTVANGFQVDPGQAPTSEYRLGETLWAVTESGTCRCDVLQQGL